MAQPMQPPPPPPPPVYVVPDAFRHHHGFTFEANLGIGFVRASGDGVSSNSDAALAGLDIGLGGWITRQLAVTIRIAGVDVSNSGDTTDGTLINAFIGPAAQYWIDPHFWVGGGIGLATLRLVGSSECNDSSGTDPCGVNGWGFDLRAGYSFGDSAHTFNVSGEITPSFYSQNGDSVTATSFALLLGYQYL
jgi:hypothetical protein